MEANEANELQEHAEHGAHDQSLRPAAFTMSVLAVLVAITTVLGHRTHTEAVLFQNKATDQWNEYQAKKIRAEITRHVDDVLSVSPVTDKEKAASILKRDTDHLAKWNGDGKSEGDLKQEQEKAEALEKRVEQAELRANRFDLAEALLEIGLVITSVTLLTRSRIYWFLGLVVSALGIAAAASVLLLH
jgi:hypothetical protein